MRAVLPVAPSRFISNMLVTTMTTSGVMTPTRTFLILKVRQLGLKVPLFTKRTRERINLTIKNSIEVTVSPGPE